MLTLNDTITLQHSKIVSKIFSQHAQNGITSYLNLFGDLYYGHLHSNIFLDRYRELKKIFIRELVNHGSEVAHNLCMLELTQREPWRWPAPLTELSSGLLWSAGNSRTVATGLVHNEPWTKLPVLILQRRGTSPNAHLSKYTRITTDKELHTALGIAYENDDTYYHPELELQATLIEDNGVPALTLKYVGNREAEQDYYSIGQARYQAFLNWQTRYGTKPALYVYTDYPERISGENWDIIHAGPVPDKDLIYKPGHLERVVRGANPVYDHSLFVVGSRKIDVDELLPWVDLNHTAFIDKNWDFMLYRRDTEYTNKFVSITQDWNKY